MSKEGESAGGEGCLSWLPDCFLDLLIEAGIVNGMPTSDMRKARNHKGHQGLFTIKPLTHSSQSEDDAGGEEQGGSA